MELHMLTTIDNPYNPWTEYEAWEAFDARLGYNTPAFLARVAITSDEMSEMDQDVAIENAIDEIIKENVLGLYIKVKDK